jgi:hypothetical protein
MPPGGAKDSHTAVEGQKTPCILQLDSLSGNHKLTTMANRLKLYLEFEWHLKASPAAALSAWQPSWR